VRFLAAIGADADHHQQEALTAEVKVSVSRLLRAQQLSIR
jgi:hypothetical protein